MLFTLKRRDGDINGRWHRESMISMAERKSYCVATTTITISPLISPTSTLLSIEKAKASKLDVMHM